MNVIDLLGDQLIGRIGWTLMHTTWQGCAIALLVALALRIMRATGPQARYLVCCTGLAGMVAAAGVTFAVLRSGSSVVPQTASVVDQAQYVGPVTERSLVVFAPPAGPQQRNPLLRYVVLSWLSGVTFMALWHIAGWTLLLRLRSGTPLRQWQPSLEKLKAQLRLARRVAIIESSHIDVPAALGMLRPIILVPVGVFSGLSPQQVEAVLAHELAHIRRHDYLVNLLQAAIETVLFYHPATWWLSSRIRHERENCCDDIAQSICGDANVYASALAALEERRGSIAAKLAPAATGGDLLNRVRRILKLPPTRTRTVSIRSLAAAALAIAFLALPLLVNAQQKPKDKPDDKPAATTETTDDVELSPITPADLKVEVQDYRMGAGDLVSISITDLVGPGVETVKSVRISDTGVVSMPLVGAVNIAGLTSIDAEKAVQKAYRDGNLIPNAQVSVTVTEARQRMIRILGGVARPGEYAMPKSDFRLLDALAAAGARDADTGSLRIVRAGPPKRTIEVPLKKLAAGDMSVNIVLQPGDLIVAAPQPKEFLRIVVAQHSLMHNGQAIDSAAVKKLLDAIPEGKRNSTVLEVSAAAPDVTVERFFGATAELSELVKQNGLAYLSQTGIQAAPDHAREKTPAKGTSLRGDEFFINGGVANPGAYSIAGGKSLNVKQAIAAAGGLRFEDNTVTVIRRDGDKDSRVLDNVTVDSLFSGQTRDVDLQPGDIVQVSIPPSGEYYMAGDVPRTGVYSLTARKITLKQAIAAAGGLEGAADDARITIIRRTGEKESTIADVSFKGLLNGETKEIVLQPNDIVQVKALVQPQTGGPQVEKLRAERDTLAVQLQDSKNKYGDQHPNVRKLQAKLDLIDKMIEQPTKPATTQR